MKRIKIGLVVVGLIAVSLLVMSAGSIPTLAGAPNPAVPTITLPTPAPTKPAAQPPAGATAPARVATRALVPPTPTKPAAPKVAPSVRGSTTKSLSTNFTLVNLATSDASASVAYTKPDGSSWAASAGSTGPFTVAGNYGQMIIAQYNDSTMTTGSGSAVVSSSQPLGAVVQILARNQTPSSGAYITSSPANTFYIPQVFRNLSTAQGLSNTQIVVQSAQSSGTTAYQVQFIPSPGSGLPSFTKTTLSALQPSASFVYDVANESASNLPDGWLGSAVVSTTNSSQNISVVASTFAGSDSLGTYNAFPAGSPGTQWSIPLFTSRLSNGLSTPVIVQNLGASIAAGGITMQCKSSVSSPSTLNLSNSSTVVATNASFGFNPVIDMSIAGNWTGSCRLTATSNVVVVVQLRQPGVNANFDTYPAFSSTGTNTTVVVPLMSKRQSNGFATVATIQNLDSANAANVTLTYSPGAACSGCSPLTVNKTIPAGGNLVQNMRLTSGADAVSVPDGWFGSLVVKPQGGSTPRPIVGFVQLTNYLTAAGDTLMTHDAFSLP